MALSQPQAEEGAQAPKKKPAETLAFPSSGGRIEVSIWENIKEGEDGSRVNYSVSLQRSYFHAGEKKWKTGNSLFPADIPVVVHALQQAYAMILNVQAKK